MKIFASAAGLMVASRMRWETLREKQVWWEKTKCSASAVLVRGSTRRSRGQVSGGGKRASEVPAGSGGRSGSKIRSWDLQTSVNLEPGPDFAQTRLGSVRKVTSLEGHTFWNTIGCELGSHTRGRFK